MEANYLNDLTGFRGSKSIESKRNCHCAGSGSINMIFKSQPERTVAMKSIYSLQLKYTEKTWHRSKTNKS